MSDVTLVVHGGRLLPAYDKPVIPNGAIAIAGEIIEAIGTSSELGARYNNARQIGGKKFMIILGLINGHGHGRGLTDFQRGTIDNTLESWLLQTRRYLKLPVYDDIAFSAIKLLKSGITTTMHNHLLRQTATFDLEFDEVLRAYRDSGIRLLFCPAIQNDN